MCGIYGWQLNDTVSQEQRAILAAVLTVQMDLRGGHGWGYYAPLAGRHGRGLGRMAGSISAAELAEHPTLLAHTRFATTGAVSRKNCHPFDVGPLVGAHNGQLTNHAELNRLYGRECKVDSQHIFHHLKEKRDLEELNAYGAIEYVWKDRPDCVHLARFNDGELAVLHLEGQGVLWASTSAAVLVASTMTGLRGVLYEVKPDRAYFARNYELWQGEALRFGSYRKYGYSQLVPTTPADDGDDAIDWEKFDECMEDYLDDHDDRDCVGDYRLTKNGRWVRR